MIARARRDMDYFVPLFSLTLFLSATLTFVMQPMIGKMLLPLVGGAPSGWLVTMAFFQLALLAGYTVAHVLSRVPAWWHVGIVFVFLLAGFCALPLHIDEGIIDSSGLPETASVFLALARGLILPCIALFSLSPSLQRLFDSASSGGARDPYFLFAASNLGSLGGLLAYPFCIELMSGLSMQNTLWRAGYGVLLILCIVCMACTYGVSHARKATVVKAAKKAAPIGWRKRGYWVFLAFIPSSLMLGLTAHVTADTGSVPLFWVLPLALYLLTFILAFAEKQIVNLGQLACLQPASIGLLILCFVTNPVVLETNMNMIVFPIIVFFLAAMFCHFTLAAARPPAARLTEYYLWIAIGGAVGGLFNTFVVPFLFPLPVEFMLVALLSCFVHRKAIFNLPKLERYIPAAIAVAVLATIGSSLLVKNYHAVPKIVSAVSLQVAGIVMLPALLLVSLRPRWLAMLGLVLGIAAFAIQQSNLLDVERNFFGVLRVAEKELNNSTVRILYHGTTLHGMEQVGPKIDTTPLAYYNPQGNLGDIMTIVKPGDVGMIGLGVGSIVCYTAPGRHYTVYEIDPQVVDLATKWFDFMRDCGTPSIHIGDGRKLLLDDRDARYDLLFVDAFSSDSIPIHLLTREAFELYFDRIKPAGVLAIHISNRFFDLRYPIGGVVSSLHLHALYKRAMGPSSDQRIFTSIMTVVARDENALESFRQNGWTDLPPPENRVWTDDYSDALSALRIFHLDNPL